MSRFILGDCVQVMSRFLMYGSVVPWGGMLIVASIYGFIQMNLNFLTLDLFYAGVFGSLAVQLVFTVIQCNCK